jgi:hypothetical protein
MARCVRDPQTLGPSPPDGRAQLTVLLLLVAVALAGVAQIAFLPPWEGYDETAHWSYVQQLADRGHAPRYYYDKLSADLDAYRGPMANGPVQDHPTYRAFRAHSLPATLGGRAIGAGPTAFHPGLYPNWQAQHPPLYYALLAPIYRLAAHLGWLDHLLALRLASWALAVGGLATASLGMLRLGPTFSRAAVAAAAWPFLAPEFFPDMARLGNDSLCLLLFGVAWVLLLRILTRRASPTLMLGLGVALGLGLLTKALFLPISAGVVALVALDGWRRGGWRGLGWPVLVGVLTLAIGGWWYLGKLQETGSLIGAEEFIRLKQAGGLVSGLRKHLSAAALAWGVAGMATSFVWAGTWSFAQPPVWTLAGPMLLLGVPLILWLWRLPRARLIRWAPVFVIAPMVLGLAYHVLVMIALSGGASTPTWYLFVLTPALAMAWASAWRWSLWQGLLLAYTAGFTALAWTIQLSVFSGCSWPPAGRHVQLGVGGCWIDPAQLSVLTQPDLGAAALAGALVVMAIACARLWRGRRTSPTLSPQPQDISP